VLGEGLGIVAAGLHVLGYSIYVYSVLRKSILPNSASYLMFAYGTALVVFLTIANGATLPQLVLPIFCAAMSIVVAILCLRHRSTEPVDRTEKLIFGADVALTLVYLALTRYMTDMAPYAVAFLLAGNATTVTSFLPIARSTFQSPYREQPAPWIVWALAYAALIGTVALETGLTHPVLFVYPVLNFVLHGLIAVFSMRKSLKGRIIYSNGENRLYHDRSRINGIGVFAGNRMSAGERIWKMSGQLHFHSETHTHPDFVGIGPRAWIDPDRPINRLNHSCAPNSAFGARRQIFALRPIAPGEEVTLDYSTTEADPDWSMECSCGAATCRGRIHAIQISFADAVAPPAASPLMQLVWHKRRVPGSAPAPVPLPTPLADSAQPWQAQRTASWRRPWLSSGRTMRPAFGNAVPKRFR
jgi:hypothetical protein